jgi:hypothetical protein
MMEIVKRHYLEMVPVDVLMREISKLTDWPSLKAQESFMVDVVQVYEEFPPSLRWLKALLKLIEKDISLQCEEGMIDSLTEKIISLQNSNCYQDEDDSAFVTCLLPKSEKATFRIMRSHNQVGTRLWAAGLFLAEVIMKHPGLLANKTVVELGAGCGCTSLLAVKSAENTESLPKKLILTDNMPTVLDNLKANVLLNETDSIALAPTEQSGSSEKCLIAVEHLDFCDASPEDCQKYEADVILVGIHANSVVETTNEAL